MARGFFAALAAAERAAYRQARAEQRARERQARAVLQAERQAARAATRLFHENQSDEADALTKEIQDRFHSLETILERSLGQNPKIYLGTLKREPPPKPLPDNPPQLEAFLPSKPGFLKWLLVQARENHEKSLRDAHDRFVTPWRITTPPN